DRAVQVDVLAARKLGMEAGADFDQRGQRSEHVDTASGRVGDVSQQLENRALARSIGSDETDRLALFDGEAHALEGVKVVAVLAPDQARSKQATGRSGQPLADCFRVQSAEPVTLPDAVNADDAHSPCVATEDSSGNVRELTLQVF